MTEEEIKELKIGATPMMAQYLDIKEKHLDSLLFYRLGDFYELFYEDAEVASAELGLVLTKKQEAPMCGIPWHAYETYLTKLIKKGYKVTICEQDETPEEARRKRGYHSPVNRSVARVVTRGTLIESTLLESNLHNFMMTISIERNNEVGISYIDISTGVFEVAKISSDTILDAIHKVNPSEIVCVDEMLNSRGVLSNLEDYKSIIHTVPAFAFIKEEGVKILKNFYGPKCFFDIDALSPQVSMAASMAVYYILNVYMNKDVCIPFPKMLDEKNCLQMDFFTMRSLELTQSQSGKKENTLIWTIDRTLTPFGLRLLSRWLMYPLIDSTKINKRLDCVEMFCNNTDLLQTVRNKISKFPDMERALSRVIMDRAGPRDVNIIRVGLRKSLILWEDLKNTNLFGENGLLFVGIETLLDVLESSIKDEVPALARDGDFIKPGFDESLDKIRNVIEDGEKIIHDLQKKYVSETKINSLKIKKNNLFGYFIEVAPNYISRVPYSFTRRQTLSSCLRYTTEELSEIADKMYSAEANVLQSELIIFGTITRRIKMFQENLKGLISKIAFVDVISSLALLAKEEKYVRPLITDTKEMLIREGFHPMVKINLRKELIDFTSNDYKCDEKSIISIITGPNMGGKSTFLRQNAIIIIMAQIGSFVPASYALIGVVDRIFSRVGAYDDISRGMSTFMVEMVETASILAKASSNSFIILDEIGRGTSTYDGLSIAISVVEDIHNRINARTIFATHYHEMVKIKEYLTNTEFLTVDVIESGGKISFPHRIVPGFASRSYGIHVAELAGIPRNVVSRAREILLELVNDASTEVQK
jgi:DNA mismatch repair protein MutS